ncbi:MAG: sulfatase [Pirellulaceae bacterium]
MRLCGPCLMGLLLVCSSLRAQPNIVFILADDLGWTDLSGGATNRGNGSDFYETPNLDALAASGVAFTDAYSSGPNCTPTRASLMGGQYAPRTGVYTVSHLNWTNGQTLPLVGPENVTRLQESAITIAETLKTVGYVSAHFGKWNIGPSSGLQSPISQGFDYNFGGGGWGQPGQYHAQQVGDGWEFAPEIGPEMDAYASAGKHITDALTDATLDFMQSNKSQPFFVSLNHYAVHTPVTPAEARADLLAKYQAKTPGIRHNNASYAALVEGLDESVGRIVAYLSATPDPRTPGQMLRENTLLVFYSDNGGEDSLSINSPLKNGKRYLDEGGIRVPLIASWPGRITSGVVSSEPVTSVDLYPTFTDLAGAARPAGYVLDGEDLMPLLDGSATALARDSIYWHYPGYLLKGDRDVRPRSVIRQRNLKLIHNYEFAFGVDVPEWELYDVGGDDFAEQTNLALDPAWAGVVIELGTDLANWLWNTGALLPLDAATGLRVDYPGQRTGDLDGDGDVDFRDIDAFVVGLNDPNGFVERYGVAAGVRGDVNRNYTFDFDDIPSFVDMLSNSSSPIPEPCSSALVAVGVLCLFVSQSGRLLTLCCGSCDQQSLDHHCRNNSKVRQATINSADSERAVAGRSVP